MDILYICNDKMRKSYIREAICNEIFTVNNIGTYVTYTTIYSKFFDGLKNNVFLLWDNTRKIMVFK
ncbi:hypothetical protein [Clostridium sp. CF012]|uniref:hypothetical protein n=1 Tax=Clostridium sp. CF012 TaxID=2843319 RepID=UPI001C0E7071|nr:hypothetical protein [Clostridium sp. CF012]MBU3143149.1 hypothetical protein [Clostridium sp. CF012]